MANGRICSFIIGASLSVMAVPLFARVTIETEGFEDGTTRPVSIALLPPQASVSTQRLIRNEAEVDESIEYSMLFARALAESLTALGYEVEIVDPDRINGDSRLREAVIDANRRNDDMLNGLRKKEIEREEYEGSEEARILANYLDVDAIAFVDLTIVGATGGKRAMSLLLGGPMGGSVGVLDLVDGYTGRLSARMTGSGSGNSRAFDEAPGHEIIEIAEAVLKKAPGADPSARIERTRSDEDILSDIESLLEE